MSKFSIDAPALAAAVLAGALALLTLPGPFGLLGSIGGLTLLLILFSFDQEGYRSVFQSIAYGSVCGFCLALASAAVFRFFAAPSGVNERLSREWLPFTWLVTTIIVSIIDRARMSARAPAMNARPQLLPLEQSSARSFTVEEPRPSPPAAPPVRAAAAAVYFADTRCSADTRSSADTGCSAVACCFPSPGSFAPAVSFGGKRSCSGTASACSRSRARFGPAGQRNHDLLKSSR